MSRMLAILILILPSVALGDGKVFSARTAFAETTIPDQRAMLCWSNGIERLVIETRFVGAGTNFAWVIPLPNPPEIEEATTGLFSTIAHLMRPKVVHNREQWFAIFLFCLGLGYLLLKARKEKARTPLEILACALVGAGVCFASPLFGVITFLVLLWTIERVRDGRESPYAILAVLVLLAFLGAMLLPALGTAGGASVAPNELTELASSRVGAFDTTTIAAKTPGALLDWLRENQFSVASGAEPVIADYIKRGWVFVAAKLARDDPSITTNSIHPLSFTFRTDQPIYPLRLTGVGNGALAVELYVFGSERAAADNFKVERCVRTTFPETSPGWRKEIQEVIVVHPLLRSWTHGNSVATKLTALLSPAQMQSDVTLRWSPFTPHHKIFYSKKGAAITAANMATGVIVCAFLLMSIVAAIRHEWWSGKIAGGIVGLGILIFCVQYFTLPKVQVRLNRYPAAIAVYKIQALGRELQTDWKKSPPKSLVEAQTIAAKKSNGYGDNSLLGGKIYQEDSPGNYVIRQTTNGFEFFWFDSYGAKHSIDGAR